MEKNYMKTKTQKQNKIAMISHFAMPYEIKNT